MFSLDPYVVEFIKGNWISLMMFLVLLRGIAKMTPTIHDDRIATLLGRVIGIAKPQDPKK